MKWMSGGLPMQPSYRNYLNKIRQCAINYYKESIDNNDIKSWNNELGEMWSDYKNTYNNIVKKRKFILN